MTNGTLNDFQRQALLRSVDYRLGEVMERIDTLAATIDGPIHPDERVVRDSELIDEMRDLQSALLRLVGAVSTLRVAYVDEIIEGQRARGTSTETE